jgi:hypothetical protein
MKTSVGELQRTYLYKLVVESIPIALVASTEAMLVRDSVDLYNTKGIFPGRKTNPIQLWWGGESYYHSGRDESTKTGDLVFRLDEAMRIKDFWEAAKDLTGELTAHVAVNKPLQALTLGVYLVRVDKKTVSDYRRLVDVLVYSVDDISPDKEGSDIQTFKVNISWDRQERDNSKRGLTI